MTDCRLSKNQQSEGLDAFRFFFKKINILSVATLLGLLLWEAKTCVVVAASRTPRNANQRTASVENISSDRRLEGPLSPANG